MSPSAPSAASGGEGAETPPTPDRHADAGIEALWGRYQGALLERVAVLDEVLAAAVEDRCNPELRHRAEQAAHRLAGSAGTLGRLRASELAAGLEAFFAGSAPLDGRRLGEALGWADELRAELEAGPPPQGRAGADQPSERPVVLVVHHDPGTSAAIAGALAAQGCRASLASSVDAAREVLACSPVAVALVELGGDEEDVFGLLATLRAGTPPAVVLALGGDGDLGDRVAALRAGVGGFLPGVLEPSDIAMAVRAALEATGRRPGGRILAVDDDESVLAALDVLLGPLDVTISGVTGPEAFWEALGEVGPDLVVLDVDMPEVSGIELCRLLRADPRWAALPVVFLTSHTSRTTVRALFDAGADDFVAKPVFGPEVLTRVANRLERTRVLRALAETDPLTGLSNRRRFAAEWERLVAMADRYHQPLAFALVDLDHFREVNNRFGHDIGDLVLQGVAELLGQRFRGEDVVARWGGEEIALAMFGMSRDDGE